MNDHGGAPLSSGVGRKDCPLNTRKMKSARTLEVFFRVFRVFRGPPIFRGRRRESPNQAAARERRDCALVQIEHHRRGVTEPRRWSKCFARDSATKGPKEHKEKRRFDLEAKLFPIFPFLGFCDLCALSWLRTFSIRRTRLQVNAPIASWLQVGLFLAARH